MIAQGNYEVHRAYWYVASNALKNNTGVGVGGSRELGPWAPTSRLVTSIGIMVGD